MHSLPRRSLDAGQTVLCTTRSGAPPRRGAWILPAPRALEASTKSTRPPVPVTCAHAKSGYSAPKCCRAIRELSFNVYIRAPSCVQGQTLLKNKKSHSMCVSVLQRFRAFPNVLHNAVPARRADREARGDADGRAHLGDRLLVRGHPEDRPHVLHLGCYEHAAMGDWFDMQNDMRGGFSRN